MKKLMFFTMLMAIGIFIALSAGSARAAGLNEFYFTITNSGDLPEGGWFGAEVYFIPEGMGDPNVANDGANNLHMQNIDLRYNTDLLRWGGDGSDAYIQHYVEEVPPPHVHEHIYHGGVVHPTENPHGYLWDTGEPYNHLVTLWFEVLPGAGGHYDDLGFEWVDRGVACFVDIHPTRGHQDELDVHGLYLFNDDFIAWKEDGLMKCSWEYVPIPGAVWLLGSGLLGLIAIRRRKG
jgi:hypothetical protein